jgi:hypothetical protein
MKTTTLLIVCLILSFSLLLPLNQLTGKFFLHTFNKSTIALIFSSISLFLILTAIRIIKVEEEKKHLPPGVHIEISTDILKSPYESNVRRGVEKIKNFLQKDLHINRIYERNVGEICDENFGYESFSEIGYGPNAITIRLTMKSFNPELYKELPYKPFGITMGNKIVISVKNILERVARNYDVSEIIGRLGKHELWHIAGGKDDPYSKGIADPYLRYEINDEEKKVMKERFLKIIYK